MSTQLVRLAAAVLSSEKGRKTVGWVLAAILSPVILLTAFLCCVGSGTAEHNSAVVSAAFYGTELSASVPEEYRMQLTQMRGSFSHLDAAVAEVNQKAEGNRLDPIQVKAVFFALCFGADTLSQTDAEAFVACFCETETRGGRRRAKPMKWPYRFLWKKSMRSYPCGGAVRSRRRNAPMP